PSLKAVVASAHPLIGITLPQEDPNALVTIVTHANKFATSELRAAESKLEAEMFATWDQDINRAWHEHVKGSKSTLVLTDHPSGNIRDILLLQAAYVVSVQTERFVCDTVWRHLRDKHDDGSIKWWKAVLPPPVIAELERRAL